MDIKKELVDSLASLLPHSQIKGNNVKLSTRVNKGGEPLTIINPKEPTAALWLIVNNDSIIVKVIENSLKQFSGTDMLLKILGVVASAKQNGIEYKILIDDDQSGGWWDKVISKYPDYDIQKINKETVLRQTIQEEIKRIIGKNI